MEQARKKWWVLATVSLTVFMAMLDITIVNVSLPHIQKEFNADFSSLQWVLNAYTLVYAVMLLPISKLGDMIGRKKIFLSGLAIFIIGSLVSGFANNELWLNIFRGFQGIGGAAMMSLSLTIVTTAFPEKQRGLALGIWSTSVGLAISAGPLIGGALVDSLGWRSIFLINIPVGILVFFLGKAFIKESQPKQNEKIDFLGLIFSTGMIFTMLLAFIQKEMHESYEWSHWHILSLLISSIIFLIAFIITEKSVKHPMIDLSLFKNKAFTGANIAAFALGAGLYGGFTYLTILMQNYMGYTAFETGVKMLLISGFTIILGPITGYISNKIGNRWVISGSLFLGAIGILLVHTMLNVPFEWKYLLPGFILLGISNALVNPSISSAAMSSVSKEQVGMASGILNVFRQVGISFGVVILGIRLSEGYRGKLDVQLYQIQSLSTDFKNQLLNLFHQAGAFSGPQLLSSKQVSTLKDYKEIRTIVFESFNSGMHNVTLLIAIFLLLGAVSSAVLIRKKD